MNGSVTPLARTRETIDRAVGRPQPSAESLAGKAYRQIEDLIVRLELKPGLLLSESELSQRLGIGRTPIREALQRLEREGLVRISPRLGLFVTEISVDAQLRLLEVRRLVEGLMAARAARLCSKDQRRAFATIAADMREAGRSGDQFWFLKLDLMFNRLVAETCGNEYAIAAIALMGGQSRRFWFRYFRADADLAATCEIHAAIADAIASGAVNAAAAASEALMTYIQEFTRRVFVALT